MLGPNHIYELYARMNSNQDNKNAKVDQGAINYSQSRAESTYYTRSLAEGLTTDRSTMQDTGDDRGTRVSVYTYNTTDKSQYLRQDRGRVSIFILLSRSSSNLLDAVIQRAE
jgi:ABC-type sulfate transport system substrate-binding protein